MADAALEGLVMRQEVMEEEIEEYESYRYDFEDLEDAEDERLLGEATLAKLRESRAVTEGTAAPAEAQVAEGAVAATVTTPHVSPAGTPEAMPGEDLPANEPVAIEEPAATEEPVTEETKE
jgi:hypothetical protein